MRGPGEVSREVERALLKRHGEQWALVLHREGRRGVAPPCNRQLCRVLGRQCLGPGRIVQGASNGGAVHCGLRVKLRCDCSGVLGIAQVRCELLVLRVHAAGLCGCDEGIDCHGGAG